MRFQDEQYLYGLLQLHRLRGVKTSATKDIHRPPTTMKTICLALGLMLLTVYRSNAFSFGLDSTPNCCFSFYRGKVPLNKIVSIQRTYTRCQLPAFIVKTLAGKALCFKASDPWVSETIDKLKKAAAAATTSSLFTASASSSSSSSPKQTY